METKAHANTNPPRPGRGGRESGFTLIELMVVVLIVALLGSIAFASYSNNVVATRRKAASACLVEQAQFMERWYTTRLTYVGADPTGVACALELATHYAFDLPGGTNPSASAYSITATPIGAQLAKDGKCGTLGLNQVGSKTKTGTGTVDDCW